MRVAVAVSIAAACLTVSGASARAQNSAVQPIEPVPIAPVPIATVPLQGVTVSGSLSLAHGRASIGNNGTITADDQTAPVTLARGGRLNVCASTTVHLTTASSSGKSGNAALMIAMDRGAIEAHYTPGKYSDVLLTPDLRILISGPGKANLSLRVNRKGDTCVDNHGDHAPYVLVSNLFEGGAYRVQPNQRVLFEGGSLKQVVDHEPEPCGCPAEPPLSVAGAGYSGAHPASRGQKAAAEENPFPLAESEGLQPPPGPATKPEVPPGTPHAQVEAPLAYSSASPALPPEPAQPTAQGAGAERAPATDEIPPAAAKPHARLLHHVGHPVGHFFRRLFGH